MDVKLADAKARLSELVNKVVEGETIHIIRRGKRVALLTVTDKPKQPIDLGMLQRITSDMPRQTHIAGDFMRTVRDEDRY